MAGVKIGYVKDIRLSGARPGWSWLIDAGVRVPKDSKATFSTLGLIGEKYVEIIPGESAGLPASTGTSLAGAQTVGFDQVGDLLSVGRRTSSRRRPGLSATPWTTETRTNLKAALGRTGRRDRASCRDSRLAGTGAGIDEPWSKRADEP